MARVIGYIRQRKKPSYPWNAACIPDLSISRAFICNHGSYDRRIDRWMDGCVDGTDDEAWVSRFAFFSLHRKVSLPDDGIACLRTHFMNGFTHLVLLIL